MGSLNLASVAFSRWAGDVEREAEGWPVKPLW